MSRHAGSRTQSDENHSIRRPQRSATPSSGVLLRERVQAVTLEATTLEGLVQSLRVMRDRKALLRMLLGLAILGLAGYTAYVASPSPYALLVLPTLAGLLIAVLRLDHVSRWLVQMYAAASRKLEQPVGDSKLRRFVQRPFLSGIKAIGSWTSGIENPHVKAGVGGAATLYYGGGTVAAGAAALGVAAAVLYMLLVVIVVVGVIGLILAALGSD